MMTPTPAERAALGLWGPVQLTKPVPVKVELPPNLRACADKQDTDPSKLQTRGDLLIGYGDEPTLRMETQECVREIVRLIDFQNTGAGLTEPPKVGGNGE